MVVLLYNILSTKVVLLYNILSINEGSITL